MDAVQLLAQTCSDEVIAGTLNWNGLAAGNGNRWTKERVTALRSYRKFPVFKPDPNGQDPKPVLCKAAKIIGAAPKTRRLAENKSKIAAKHPLEDGRNETVL